MVTSVKQNKSSRTRQNIYGNILVGLSFLVFSFLVSKTFSPDVVTNANTDPATYFVGPYSMSLSATDNTYINALPTNQVYTGINEIYYTNTCPHGFMATISSKTASTDLVRIGDDTGIKNIPTITTGTTLANNTWGYSINNGYTYDGVPANTSPAVIIDTSSANANAALLNLVYGVKIDNDTPAGTYTGDVIYTVYPKQKCLVYNLKWNLNGGVGASGISYADQLINFGSAINLQTYAPSLYGYIFSGWRSSENRTFSASDGYVDINPTDAPELTLVAQWTPINYPITYALNGGSASNLDSYNIETTSFTLNNPTRNGYDFTGWSGTDISGNSMSVTIPQGSTGERNYTASWTPINYTISYALNGGSVSGNPTSYNIETNAITLNNPTRNGYNFAGWTGSNGTTKQTTVTIPKGSTGNKTYTANWTPINYTISYALNGGSATNPTSYNIEANTFTLNNPTRSNYVFTGWSGTGLSGSANTTVTITNGSTGNRSYTANWRELNLSDISNMQQMTSSICSATTVGTTKNLTDTRDNNVYTVKKLADGRCWMTQNLRLINKFISSTDSNLPAGLTWTVPASNISSFTRQGYNTNAAFYYDKVYGYFYSFYTATAGWGTTTLTSESSPRDICPKGWRLPTSGPSGGEFQTLYDNYNSPALMQGTPGIILSGHIYDGEAWSQRSAGYYWSSTSWGTYRTYAMYITDSVVNTSDDIFKTYGAPVRCIAK